MTTARFVTITCAVVALAFLGILSIVALEIANKPVSTVVYLMGGFTVTTIPSLIGLLKVSQLSHDVHNGIQDSIAQKAADKVAETAAVVAAGLALPGGRRASDPPAPGAMIVPQATTPTGQEGAA